jgi:hypothetical protein
VQVRGVPPKWCNCRTLTKIASSLGRTVEVDWNSLFSSFFGMVRIRIACKDISKIPSKRLFEMRKLLYVIQFNVEKLRVKDMLMMEAIMTTMMVLIRERILVWRS